MPYAEYTRERPWDCTAANLRFLCPNCHSQTATYAGRNKARRATVPVRVDERGATAPDIEARVTSDEERLAVLRQVPSKEIPVVDAARLIGCHRHQVYELERRLRERGSLAKAARRPRLPGEDHDAIVAVALRYPQWGRGRCRRTSDGVRTSRSQSRTARSATS